MVTIDFNVVQSFSTKFSVEAEQREVVAHAVNTFDKFSDMAGTKCFTCLAGKYLELCDDAKSRGTNGRMLDDDIQTLTYLGLGFYIAMNGDARFDKGQVVLDLEAIEGVYAHKMH